MRSMGAWEATGPGTTRTVDVVPRFKDTIFVNSRTSVVAYPPEFADRTLDEVARVLSQRKPTSVFDRDLNFSVSESSTSDHEPIIEHERVVEVGPTTARYYMEAMKLARSRGYGRVTNRELAEVYRRVSHDLSNPSNVDYILKKLGLLRGYGDTTYDVVFCTYQVKIGRNCGNVTAPEELQTIKFPVEPEHPTVDVVTPVHATASQTFRSKAELEAELREIRDQFNAAAERDVEIRQAYETRLRELNNRIRELKSQIEEMTQLLTDLEQNPPETNECNRLKEQFSARVEALEHLIKNYDNTVGLLLR